MSSFDSATHQFILFGGNAEADPVSNDTWAFTSIEPLIGPYALTLTTSAGTSFAYRLVVQTGGTWEISARAGGPTLGSGTIDWDEAASDWVLTQSFPAASSHFSVTASDGTLSGTWYPAGGMAEAVSATRSSN